MTDPESRRPEPRKPFLAIAPDVDDEALERMARAKGVPALKPIEAATPPKTPAIAVPEVVANDPAPPAGAGEIGDTSPDPARPTPRARTSIVKVGLPDYALTALKTRAMTDKVSLNHLLLKGLDAIGIDIRPADMIEDGRRLRGRRAVPGAGEGH